MKSARLGIRAVLFFACALMATSTVSRAASFTVHPGESIQAAVDAAAAGDTVKVMPGDYTETHAGTAAVRITKPLKLIAKSKLTADPPVKVRILPGGSQSDGIVVEPNSPGDPDVDGVMIKGFTVEGFQNNGIWLKHVQNFKINGNETINNEENGIWPTLSANGLVKKNLSYGSKDSALWIEASENVRAIKNELHSSPTGLEITISKDIQVKKNDIHDNTVGIGLYHPNAAGLPQPPGYDGFWDIKNNHVYNNNAVNTAPPGSMSASLPPGIGILLLGVDNITIKKNLIENNDFIGMGVIDWCIAAALAGSGSDCTANPPVNGDSVPDDNEVVHNQLVSNGTDPGSDPVLALFASDITFIPGTGINNCFNDNEATSIVGTLSPCS